MHAVFTLTMYTLVEILSYIEGESHDIRKDETL